jgi:branched-chain amino acid transport system permease protein
MNGALLQFVAGGLTAGAIYALVALGFSIIYNASHAINFAQGEFVMIGGMAAVALAPGLPLWAAVPLAVLAAAGVGVAVHKLAIEPARRSAGTDVVTLIIITIGVSLFLRGAAQVLWDKRIHALPPFSGSAPIAIGPATIVPQSLWVLGGAALAVLALRWFFQRTLFGKAMLATAHNPLAARLMGIPTARVMAVSFALAVRARRARRRAHRTHHLHQL